MSEPVPWDDLAAACAPVIDTHLHGIGPRILTPERMAQLEPHRAVTLIGSCPAGHRLRVGAVMFADLIDRAVKVAGVVLAWGRVHPPGRPYTERGVTGVLVPCPHCPEQTAEQLACLRELRGTYDAEAPCTASCTQAYGPVCVCQCGGVNHGIDHDHAAPDEALPLSTEETMSAALSPAASGHSGDELEPIIEALGAAGVDYELGATDSLVVALPRAHLVVEPPVGLWCDGEPVEVKPGELVDRLFEQIKAAQTAAGASAPPAASGQSNVSRISVRRRTPSAVIDGAMAARPPGALWRAIRDELREAWPERDGVRLIESSRGGGSLTAFGGLAGRPPVSMTIHRDGRIVVPGKAGAERVERAVLDSVQSVADRRQVEAAVERVIELAVESNIIDRRDVPLTAWPAAWWSDEQATRPAWQAPPAPAASSTSGQSAATATAPSSPSSSSTTGRSGSTPSMGRDPNDDRTIDLEDAIDAQRPAWWRELDSVLDAESETQRRRRVGRAAKRRELRRWVPPADAPETAGWWSGKVGADGSTCEGNYGRERHGASVRLIVALWGCGFGVRPIGDVLELPKSVIGERLQEAAAERRHCEAVTVAELVDEHGLGGIQR